MAKATIYTDELRDKIIADSKSNTMLQICEKYGLKKKTLTYMCSLWRKKGYTIYSVCRPYEGEVRIREKELAGPTKFIYISGKWKPEHVHNWEANYGPIPPLHGIAFKDGIRLNTDISNLELQKKVDMSMAVTKTKKVNLNGNWVKTIKPDAPEKIKAHEPLSAGIRLDSRTVVYPKKERPIEELQAVFGNRPERIKNDFKKNVSQF